MGPRLNIRLFDRFQVFQGSVEIEGYRTRFARLLLAYLALYPGAHSRIKLIDLLWPNGNPQTEGGRLSTELSYLRSLLEKEHGPEPSIFLTNRPTIQLRTDSFSTDIFEFEQVLDRVHKPPEDQRSRSGLDERQRIQSNLINPGERRPGDAGVLFGECTDDQIDLLKRAVEIYRGPLLSEFYDVAQLTGPRATYERRYVLAVQQLLQGLETRNDLPGALSVAETSLRVCPFNEVFLRALMQIYLKSGQSGLAMECYSEFERKLQDEEGRRPSVETDVIRQAIQDKMAKTTNWDRNFASQIKEAEAVTVSIDSILPSPKNPLFGRERELQALSEWLIKQGSLVSIIGPGGIGKTRLAIEVAWALRQRHGRYVYWMDVSELSSETDVLSLLCEMVGVKNPATFSQPSKILDQVAISLLTMNRDHRAQFVFVWDNFDSLVETTAHLIGILRQKVPFLSCLVTSRRRLSLTGEREVHLEPLSTPPDPETARYDQIPVQAGGELDLLPASLQLLIYQVRLVNPTFTISSENFNGLANLCRRLDGIPLALEFIAPHFEMLTPAQVLRRLEQGTLQLRSRRRDSDPRHLSLEAILAWSFESAGMECLLVLKQLTVFRGSWTLEAAERVCGPDHPALDSLFTRLRDYSLLRVDDKEGELRFSMLETVRQYVLNYNPARFALTEASPKMFETSLPQENGGDSSVYDLQELRNAHLLWYRDFAEKMHRDFTKEDIPGWMHRIRAELSNLRAALEYARKLEEWPSGLRIATSLRRFWGAQGYFEEGMNWIIEMLDGGDPVTQITPNDRSEAMMVAGNLAYRGGRFEQAKKLYSGVFDLARSTNRETVAMRARASLGNVARAMGDCVLSRVCFLESLRYFVENDDLRSVGLTISNLTLIGLDERRYAEVVSTLRFCVGLFREFNDLMNLCQSLTNLAEAILRHTMLRDTLTPASEPSIFPCDADVLKIIENRFDERFTQIIKDTTVPEVEHVPALLTEAFGYAVEADDSRRIGNIFVVGAVYAIYRKRAHEASRLLGLEEALRHRAGFLLPEAFQQLYTADVAQLYEMLSPEKVEAAWQSGHAIPRTEWTDCFFAAIKEF